MLHSFLIFTYKSIYIRIQHLLVVVYRSVCNAKWREHKININEIREQERGSEMMNQNNCNNCHHNSRNKLVLYTGTAFWQLTHNKIYVRLR